MKHHYFNSKKQIEIYFEKNYSDKKAFYSIIKSEKYYFFFTRWTVLFYEAKDLENKIKELLFSLLEQEFNIQIKDFRIDFANIEYHEINAHLKTNNDGLLVGKFRQNQKSLETYLSKAISFCFKKKYEIFLDFTYHNHHNQKNHHHNHQVHHHKHNQKKDFITSKPEWKKKPYFPHNKKTD